jgi:hypothetical protein
MMVKVTLEATLTFPEGTKWPSFGEIGSRAFTLPNGDTIKPWVALELNDSEDLKFTQLGELGIDITEGSCTIEAAGWAS